jgi:hypothetical protein
MQRRCSSEGGELNINAKIVLLRRRGIKDEKQNRCFSRRREVKYEHI